MGRVRTLAGGLLPIVISGLLGGALFAQGDSQKVSSFGKYEGYSPALHDEWISESVYVEMRDGVKLAVDVTRPAIDGVAVDAAYPVIWTHSRYHRNMFASGIRDGRVRTNADVYPPLQRLVRHGYVLCAAGVRGSGASFGRCEGLFAEAETLDAVELIEWFAAQPWCDGNVGMYGGSYLGITQYMAAAHSPPALKAIFPDVAAFDMYDLVYPGGVFRRDTFQHWSNLTVALDTQVPPSPVTEDVGGVQLREAVSQHTDNWDVMDGYSSAPFRDSVSEELDWSTHGPSVLLDEINAAKVPAYHINGWFDVFALDATLWFANYEGPQRLTMGAWSHADLSRARTVVTSAEQHRWFDRWLKGIENGIDTEPPVQYALMNEPGDWDWVAAESWPITGTEALQLYFGAGRSGSVDSKNDGALGSQSVDQEFDEYRVDPTTTTGSASRWDNAVGQGPMSYSSLEENDEKSLTYTSGVLPKDITVVGHPVAELFVTSSSGDADIYVLLEEVDDEGEVHYVSEGVVRASQRKLSESMYNNMGLPFQRCLESDWKPLSPDDPSVVSMDLHPTANVFNAGHRIRVTIMGADQDNTEASPFVDDTMLRVYRGGMTGSSIHLPVLP